MSFYKWFDTYKLNKIQKYTHKDQMEDAWSAANEEVIKLIYDMKTKLNDDFDVNDPKGNLVIQSNCHILELLKIAIETEKS